MKTALILAALFVAFGFVGTVDYQAAAGLAAEHSRPAVAVAAWGKP